MARNVKDLSSMSREELAAIVGIDPDDPIPHEDLIMLAMDTDEDERDY